MSCDPNQLVESAKCFQCLSSQQLQMVTNYLLCQILQNGGAGSGLVLGEWVSPVFPPPNGSKGDPGQEVLLNWTNTTGKIQWVQFDVVLSQQGASVSICDVLVDGNNTFPHYSPQTPSGDEEDFFFGTILAPGGTITTVYDLVADNTHRVQNFWYRTLN